MGTLALGWLGALATLGLPVWMIYRWGWKGFLAAWLFVWWWPVVVLNLQDAISPLPERTEILYGFTAMGWLLGLMYCGLIISAKLIVIDLGWWISLSLRGFGITQKEDKLARWPSPRGERPR
jgi:hypothetical protein